MTRNPHVPADHCLPAASLRLRDFQLGAIRPGLQLIVARLRYYEKSGGLPYQRPQSFSQLAHDSGTYDADLALLLESLARKIAVGRKSRRLRLNAFELAACILGARITRQQAQHGHIECQGASAQRCRRLVALLEKYRKRAKRLAEGARGSAAWKESSSHWREFVLWLRLHLLHCSCGRPVFPGSRRWNRTVIDALEQRVRRGLAGAGLCAPEPAVLRRYIRMLLRYIRRDRTEFGVRSLLVNRDWAQPFLAQFVEKRCAKEGRVLKEVKSGACPTQSLTSRSHSS